MKQRSWMCESWKNTCSAEALSEDAAWELTEFRISTLRFSLAPPEVVLVVAVGKEEEDDVMVRFSMSLESFSQTSTEGRRNRAQPCVHDPYSEEKTHASWIGCCW